MKLSVGIIESEAYHARYLEDQLKIWNKSACQDLQIHHIGPEDTMFLPVFRDMDVLFLDVHFNQNSGLELAKKLRGSGFSHAIILLSTHDKYALYGYDIHAFHYLIKPVSSEKIKQCMDEILNASRKNYYLFQTRDTLQKIPFSDILYFESSGHYIRIITPDKTYSRLASLKAVSSGLPGNFIQCHRTCIVNIDHIVALKNRELHLTDGSLLSVSNTYYPAVQAALMATAG